MSRDIQANHPSEIPYDQPAGYKGHGPPGLWPFQDLGLGQWHKGRGCGLGYGQEALVVHGVQEAIGDRIGTQAEAV
jgi:hypothetical protein